MNLHLFLHFIKYINLFEIFFGTLACFNVLAQILSFLFVTNTQNHFIAPFGISWLLSELRHGCSNHLVK